MQTHCSHSTPRNQPAGPREGEPVDVYWVARICCRLLELGFKEAINIAVFLVGLYLAFSAVITAVALLHVLEHPHLFVDWKGALYAQHSSLLAMTGVPQLGQYVPKLEWDCSPVNRPSIQQLHATSHPYHSLLKTDP